LKKFKSNANESEELNILAEKCGQREGKSGRGMRNFTPLSSKRGKKGCAELCEVAGVAALSRRELVQD